MYYCRYTSLRTDVLLQVQIFTYGCTIAGTSLHLRIYYCRYMSSRQMYYCRCKSSRRMYYCRHMSSRLDVLLQVHVFTYGRTIAVHVFTYGRTIAGTCLDYFAYMHEMMKWQKEHPELPVINIYFEDVKKVRGICTLRCVCLLVEWIAFSVSASVSVCLSACLPACLSVCLCLCLSLSVYPTVTSYLEHQTNDWVQSKIIFLVDYRNLFWHVSRDGNLHGSGMSHVTTASPKPSFRAPWRVGRRRGRQRKFWMDKIKEWTYLHMPEPLTRASCRNDWKRISAETSLMFPRRPNQTRE